MGTYSPGLRQPPGFGWNHGRRGLARGQKLALLMPPVGIGMTGGRMSDVFVSYNREDLKTAQTIVDGLIAEGFNVWMDMNLQAGENYDEITEDHLHKARAVVVLWSSRSVKSRWVRAEATIGARKNTLVPLMIEPCDRPVMFELIQTTDLSGWSGDREDPAWLAFIEVIKKRLAATPLPSGGSESRGGGPAAAKAQIGRASC